jgi:hypothetical protein
MLFGSHFNPAFHGQLLKDGIQTSVSGDLFKEVLKLAEEYYGMKINSNVEGDRPDSEEEDGHIISEEDLEAYSLPEEPKFESKLPNEHFIQRYMAYGADISDAYLDYWLQAVSLPWQ